MTRSALVVTHSGRPAAIAASREATAALTQAGFEVTQYEDNLGTLRSVDVQADGEQTNHLDAQYRGLAADAEIVVVLGGDGTILRAAELVHGADTPILGINLGHVGFLAESELGGLRDAVRQIAERNYSIDERGTIDVVIRQSHDAPEITGWALNEATLEKGNRERMIEVVIEVDQRPVSTFGCDGVVVSTATGSTAHAFSAGGPIMWPNVDGMVLVPISAHALFARPMVVGPGSVVAIDVTARTEAEGVVTLDGRRRIDLQPTGRIEVRRGEHPIRLVRLSPEPFTDRLVSKFNLPVAGWRGPISDPAGD